MKGRETREKEKETGRQRQWGTPVACTCVRFSAVNERPRRWGHR